MTALFFYYTRLFQKLQKTIKRTFFQVIQIIFIGISFPLKRNIAIRQLAIAVIQQPNQIFQNIPNKENKPKQLFLLAKMYQFVIDQYIIITATLITQKDKRINANGTKRLGNYLW